MCCLGNHCEHKLSLASFVIEIQLPITTCVICGFLSYLMPMTDLYLFVVVFQQGESTTTYLCSV